MKRKKNPFVIHYGDRMCATFPRKMKKHYLCAINPVNMIRKVYKFGGASVKDTDAVRNLKAIVEQHKNDDILLVVSAMGKTTNKLEAVLAEFRKHNGQLGFDALSEVVGFHEDIIVNLFDKASIDQVVGKVSPLFLELYDKLQETDCDYDYQYDQTVCYGELISTTIIATYLNESGVPTRWLDARKYVMTDTNFRSANLDWDETRVRIQRLLPEHINGIVCLTQGFIGSTTDEKHSTTLGREGSDFTAAIFANCLDAEEVTIWKDVDGLLNADPKRFADTVKIAHISYSEAIELAFYGATVIHPKTIKPLQNKSIRLKIQSFVHPNHEPTLIDGTKTKRQQIPSYIVKDNQTLLSVSPRDYSFMDEWHLQTVFGVCNELKIHANMIQTSALTLSICFDSDETKIRLLVNRLKKAFKVLYNTNLQLFTIRHYKEGTECEYVKGKRILVKQSSRSTMQFVLG